VSDKVSRRSFLKVAITGAVGFALGYGAGWFLGSSINQARIVELMREIEELKSLKIKPTFEGKINIYNWSYYINEALLDVFAGKTGISRGEIVYDVFEDPAEPLAKLEAGRSGYDVIILPDYCVHYAIKRNLLKEIDLSLIPNFKFVDEEFKNPPFDPGNRHSITYMWGTTGFAWRSDLVPEGVVSLRQIFDPNAGFLEKYKRKITMLEEALEVVVSCKVFLGRNINDWSDKTLEEVKEVLKRQKQYIAAYAGTSVYYEGLSSGAIYVAHSYNGDIMRLWSDKPETKDKVKYRVPEEGGTKWTDNLCIPKDSQHPITAHEFINFLLDPVVEAINSTYIGYANPVSASKVFIPEDILNEPAVYPPDEIRRKLWFLPMLTEEEKRKLDALWEEVKIS